MATTVNSGSPAISTFKNSVTNILPFPKLIEMSFPGVMFRFYPLRADRDTLQVFCDKYLNFKDERTQPPVYFRVPLPYVLLQLIDYPKMEEEDLWLKAREVIFSIPLEWYTRDKNGLHFQNWGMTFPFMYLSSPISIAVGREIYGFPKIQMQVVEDPTQPARAGETHSFLRPSEERRLLAYNLPRFSSSNPGEPQVFSESFLEIYQDPRPYPWSITRPADLFSFWPRAAASYLSTISALAEATSAMTRAAVETPALWALPKAFASLFEGAADQFQRVAGASLAQAAATVKTDFRMPSAPDLATFAKMIQQGMGLAGAWLPEMFAPFVKERSVQHGGTTASPFMENVFSLKQFPDASEPNQACYQAIVRSSSKFETAIDTGLLFDPISGDPSGGVSIRLYDREPIVKALGIQAEFVQDYANVKPMFPFWWNLKVGYGTAENVCWRTKGKAWSEPGEKSVGDDSAEQRYVLLSTSADKMEVAKPFAKPSEVTINILPLKATSFKDLSGLCEALVNYEDHNFTPAATYILMFVSQYRDMESARGEKRADTEVTFAMPAYYEGTEKPVLLPLIGFVEAEWNAITDREIYGRFSLQASIRVCDETIIENLARSIEGCDEGKAKDPEQESSAQVKSELWFYVESPLMADKDEKEIREAYSMFSVRRIAGKSGARSAEWEKELGKWLKAVGFYPGDNTPTAFESVALKQFRDAADPINSACYRSLVKLQRSCAEPRKEWVKSALRVVFREYTKTQIASALCIAKDKLSPPHHHYPHIPLAGADGKPAFNSIIFEAPIGDYVSDIEGAIQIKAKFVAGTAPPEVPV